ncbi:hypothetical protein F53441_5474 [Fusarium austroafricanum]|uniref:Uncharacterized protein n=1 Tax=Fusarium austroafricanum TaxID=2364996 RepID=A0A8H4KLX1_9HYPO|nr:hypothetical protein F53441_5474 [Fusarium austroafricanum]
MEVASTPEVPCTYLRFVMEAFDISQTSADLLLLSSSVFGDSRSPTAWAEASQNMCELLDVCHTKFHIRSIGCNEHFIGISPCYCPAYEAGYFGAVADSLSVEWKRPVLAVDIQTFVELVLRSRVESLLRDENEKRGYLALYEADILLCDFIAYRHTHGWSFMDKLNWSYDTALDRQSEIRQELVTKREAELAALAEKEQEQKRQREHKEFRQQFLTGNPSAAQIIKNNEADRERMKIKRRQRREKA